MYRPGLAIDDASVVDRSATSDVTERLLQNASVALRLVMPPEASPRPVPALDTKALVARLWQRNLPVLRERLDLLDQAASRAESGALSPEDRTEAADLAHKLAGSLGMFGFPKGTDTAREMEILLEADGPLPTHRLRDLTDTLRSTLPL